MFHAPGTQPLCCEDWDSEGCKCRKLKEYWAWDGKNCEFICPECCGECDYDAYSCLWWKEKWTYVNGECSYDCPHCCAECDYDGNCLSMKPGWWYYAGTCVDRREYDDDDDDDDDYEEHFGIFDKIDVLTDHIWYDDDE